jgi:hypothetical protein
LEPKLILILAKWNSFVWKFNRNILKFIKVYALFLLINPRNLLDRTKGLYTHSKSLQKQKQEQHRTVDAGHVQVLYYKLLLKIKMEKYFPTTMKPKRTELGWGWGWNTPKLFVWQSSGGGDGEQQQQQQLYRKTVVFHKRL